MTLSLADPMEGDLFPLLGLGHPYRPYRKPYVFFEIYHIYTHVQIETRHEKTKAVWLSGKRAIAFATTMLSMLSLAPWSLVSIPTRWHPPAMASGASAAAVSLPRQAIRGRGAEAPLEAQPLR